MRRAILKKTGVVTALSTGAEVAGTLQQGTASWYGPDFQGRLTATGERFDTHDLTAAHKTIPFGTKVRVTNKHTASRWWSVSTIGGLTCTAGSLISPRHRLRPSGFPGWARSRWPRFSSALLLEMEDALLFDRSAGVLTDSTRGLHVGHARASSEQSPV